MLGQKHCSICAVPALRRCQHLALAAEARDFVRRCVELSDSQSQWQLLCDRRRSALHHTGEWSSEREDFMWLETAFCNEFLKDLRWFHGIDHEWRTVNRAERGGFWVLLWSKEPRRLWWELRDEIERQAHTFLPTRTSAAAGVGGPWLFPPAAPGA
jgi:hypothetical protein